MHFGYLSALTKTIQITPDDDNDFPDGFVSRVITCVDPGTIVYMNQEDETYTATLFAGQIYPIVCKRILLTGTTAQGIEAHG